MLLKKITLYNFRPFKGKHEIVFSTDKEKNITLVMAENGSGKTTLAKAFQWVLYGKMEGFKYSSALNKLVEKEMLAGTSETVKIELELSHNGKDYTIVRTQEYRKDINENIKAENSILDVISKQDDGQTNFSNTLKNSTLVSSILPELLSKYFFFDGERIDTMAKEVSIGKSEEFKTAVQNLLGLTALMKSIEHLNPNSKDSVIGRYNSQIDALGDKQTRDLRDQIYKASENIEKNNKRIEQIKEDVEYYKSEIAKSIRKIESFAEAEKAQKHLNKLNAELAHEKEYKRNAIVNLMSNFSKETYSYFSRKLIKDALEFLKETDHIDKGIPGVRAETVKHLLARKKCLCGADLTEPTCQEVRELIELLKFIPPQSLSTSIKDFVDKSNGSVRNSSNYYKNMTTQLGVIRQCSTNIDEKENEIGDIDQNLLKTSNSEITYLKNRQIDFERTLKARIEELNNLKADNIVNEREKSNAEAEINKLQLKIQRNQSIEIQRQYAKAAYDMMKMTYDFEENKTRENLEAEINNLFKQIYAGGMRIDVDEKYRITTYVDELGDDNANIDSNTAKSFSIIFAFIVGVINLAKKKVNDKNNENAITDEYPLVMDAPLSSFDQRRIKNICSTIPNIARQVIIFIKDTDGNIAKEEMKEKIGIEYEVALKDRELPLDSNITKVGEYYNVQ